MERKENRSKTKIVAISLVLALSAIFVGLMTTSSGEGPAGTGDYYDWDIATNNFAPNVTCVSPVGAPSDVTETILNDGSDWAVITAYIIDNDNETTDGGGISTVMIQGDSLLLSTAAAMTKNTGAGEYNWTYNLTTTVAPGVYHLYINATDDGTTPGPMYNNTMDWQGMSMNNNITITVVQVNRDITVTASGFPNVIRNEDAALQGGDLTAVFTDPDVPTYASALTFEMMFEGNWVPASPSTKDFGNFSVKLLSTGNVTITPNADMYTAAAGENVEFRATDHPTTTPMQPSKMATHTVNVKINPVNDAPVVNATIDPIVIDEDTEFMIYNLTMFFNDDKDMETGNLLFTTTYAGDNLTVDFMDSTTTTDTDAYITLTEDWYGDDVIGFMAEDADGEYALQNVTITVAPINDAPEIEKDGGNYTDFKVTGNQGDTLMIEVDVMDVDDEAFTFGASILSGLDALPANFAIDANTGVITYTATNADSMMFYVNITATDGGGGAGSSEAIKVYSNFTFDITNINDEPTAPGDIDVVGGTLGSDMMTYTVVNKSLMVNVMSSAAMDIDEGYLTNHALTYEWDMDNDGVADITESSLPTDSISIFDVNWTYTAEGNYTINFTVKDQGGLTNFTQIMITMDKGNMAPTGSLIATSFSGTNNTALLINGSVSDDFGVASAKIMIKMGDTTVKDEALTITDGTFSYSFMPTAPGTYSITVTVTDSDGLTFTTPASTLTVADDDVPPVDDDDDDDDDLTMSIGLFSYDILIILIVVIVVVLLVVMMMKKKKPKEEALPPPMEQPCPGCGTMIPGGAEICPGCGAPAPPPAMPEQPMDQPCPACGQIIPAGAEVCPACGQPAPQPQMEQPMEQQCPHCGQYLPAGAEVCPSCGQPAMGQAPPQEGYPPEMPPEGAPPAAPPAAPQAPPPAAPPAAGAPAAPQQPPAQTVPCPTCQNPIAIGQTPCPGCGTALNWG